MFLRVLCLLAITSWFEAQCYIITPSMYRQAERALHRYSSHSEHNPIIFSLLNTIVYDKRAKAFTTDEAIEQALEDVKRFNINDAEILHEMIYGTSSDEISKELKKNIQSALDAFFSEADLDDYETFELLSNKRELK